MRKPLLLLLAALAITPPSPAFAQTPSAADQLKQKKEELKKKAEERRKAAAEKRAADAAKGAGGAAATPAAAGGAPAAGAGGAAAKPTTAAGGAAAKPAGAGGAAAKPTTAVGGAAAIPPAAGDPPELVDLRTTRPARRLAELTLVKARWGTLLEQQPARDELRRHVRQLAFLQRARAVAEKDKQTKVVTQVDELLTAEETRHGKTMNGLRGAAPAGAVK